MTGFPINERNEPSVSVRFHTAGGLGRRKQFVAMSSTHTAMTIDRRTPICVCQSLGRSCSSLCMRLFYIRYGMKRNTRQIKKKEEILGKPHKYKHRQTVFTATTRPRYHSLQVKVASTHTCYALVVNGSGFPRILHRFP